MAGPTSDKLFDENAPHSHSLVIGDVVAVPFVNEDKEKSFWLGKCLRIMENSKILLGWLKQVDESDTYMLKLGASWEEVSGIVLFHILKSISNC